MMSRPKFSKKLKSIGNMPEFGFFLYQDKLPLEKDSAGWSAFLPTDRKASSPSSCTALSYGDYFLAVRAFCDKHFPDADKISVRIQKHGEFYHPSKAEVERNGKTACFVINAAVSEIGKHCIEREYLLLKELGRMVSPPFIPQVYAIDKIQLEDGREIPMFSGQWFDGYHEFHLSENSDGNMGLVVWDTDKGNYFLSEDQTLSLYRQAAKILTLYYNPDTFEQIFPWHHAAGDFVVKCDDAHQIDVKLITVRQYISPMECEENDTEAVMGGLLAFLINLSVRMRLDRADGVGDIVWADDVALTGTVQGFSDALKLKPSYPEKAFRNYLESWSKEDVSEMAEAIIGSYHPQSPEIPVIRQHLPPHIALLADSWLNICHGDTAAI